MSAVVSEMPFVNSVALVDDELAGSIDQGEVFSDREGAVIKEYVVIWAQAENIVGDVWTIVRSAERPNMRGLCRDRPDSQGVYRTPGICSHGEL